jgi:hypothetical protein
MSKAALITSITNAITTNGVGGITGAVLRAQLISIVDETYPADASSFKTINSETITGVGDIVITKSSLGLSNVDNTSDANKPVSTLQAAADAAVLATAQSYADSLVVGLLDDRGNYNASTNLFPTTGGSGTAGAIKKGDLFTISVAGTLGGNAVTPGDVIRALSDTPGQTAANWAITENNIGYVPLNSASNLSDVVSASSARSNLGLGSLATLSTATPTTGGTGLTSYTTGDLIYSSATNVLSKLAAGTSGQVLTISGGLPVWATATSGAALSGLTAATGSNSINNVANTQTWAWNSLAGGSGLILSSTSTAAASNTQTILEITQSGANATSTQSTYGIKISNKKTGTASTNIGIDLDVSGGGTNNAINVTSGSVLLNNNSLVFGPASNMLQFNGQLNTNANTIQNSPNAGTGQIHAMTCGGYYQFSFGMNASYNAPYFSMGGTVWNNGTTYYSYGTNSILFRDLAGDLAISQDASLSYGGTFTPTERIRFKANGTVGIGTSSPSANTKLEITTTTTMPIKLTPMTATQASALTAEDGGLIYVSDTNGTFTSIGFWGRENGVWVKL